MLAKTVFLYGYMDGATIGAWGHILPPCKGDRGGQNISSTYYTHVTKSIFYTFTQPLCHCNKFQSRHNSHTGHCYVISFGAGERLDVIITIMKLAMFCFMSPRLAKGGGVKKFFCSLRLRNCIPIFKTVVPPLYSYMVFREPT